MSNMISGYCRMEVQSFIAGCAEIPLLFKHLQGDYTSIDPTLLLAKEVVRYAAQNGFKRMEYCERPSDSSGATKGNTNCIDDLYTQKPASSVLVFTICRTQIFFLLHMIRNKERIS
ncbi:hypothetical protein [Pelosinus propionicus]|uniref:hypothetical protein n=1 Tax=Pelosinus propionicus TaxID=380084 RepID=UPI001FE1B1B7|nr:hypothetical protein [Pelosinus propionicus]